MKLVTDGRCQAAFRQTLCLLISKAETEACPMLLQMLGERVEI